MKRGEVAKNLFRYKLEEQGDIYSSTFYNEFLNTEKRKLKPGQTIYIVVSEISFNMLSGFVWNVLKHKLKVVVIINKPYNNLDLVSSFMNNKFEGNLSRKGLYGKNARILLEMYKQGQLEILMANEEYHLSAITGYTTLFGIEKLIVDKDFKNGFVFWEDYEEYSNEIVCEIEKIYRKCSEAVPLIQVLEYLSKNYKLEDIYYLMLLNIFQIQEYKYEMSDINSLDMSKKSLWNTLYDFQKDGVYGLVHRINKHGFALLGDSVGLGKTYQALAVIQYYTEKRGDRALVLSPVKLYKNWDRETGTKTTNSFKDIHFTFDVHYHTTVTSTVTPQKGSIEEVNYTKYGLLVIDEAHAYRNSNNKRYKDTLNKILLVNPQIKVLLLTATPVNNSLSDLTNLVHLMSKGANTLNIDDRKVDYKVEISKAQKRIDCSLEPGEQFYTFLDEILVSRDKTYVKEIYKNTSIKFPQKKPAKSVEIEIDSKDKLKIMEFYNTISNLNFAAYNYFQYIKEESKADFRRRSINISERSMGMKALMQMLLVKRYESTYSSLSSTIEKIIEQMEGWLSIDNEDSQKFVKNIVNNKLDKMFIEMGEERPEYEDDLMIKRRDFTNEFFLAVQNDILQLKKIKDDKQYEKISDKKVNALKEIIKKILNSKQKVIVFTSYSDTAQELSDKLNEASLDHGLVTGDTYKIYRNALAYKMQSYEDVLCDFSPKSKRNDSVEGEIDILIATDVISEGQNLQDCSNIINFDVHWNPVRIIQRLGRIDRLQSEHEYINNYIFWPMDSLEEYLNMKQRIGSKNKAIHAVGTEGYEEDSDFNTTKEQLQLVSDGIDIEKNTLLSSSSKKHLKKYELDYKRIKQEMEETSAFYNIADFVHELRGVAVYKYSSPITSSSFLLYRVSSKVKFKSDLYPYILIELDAKLNIKCNPIPSLENIQKMYVCSLLENDYKIYNHEKKEFYNKYLKEKLKEIPIQITRENPSIMKEELSLVCAIYTLPGNNNMDRYSNFDINEPTFSFDELEKLQAPKEECGKVYISEEKANNLFE